MARITLSLKANERDALCLLAKREFRDPRAQAALIIRRELERAGLVPDRDRAETQCLPDAGGEAARAEGQPVSNSQHKEERG